MKPSIPQILRRWRRDHATWREFEDSDELAAEEPLEIRVRGQSLAVTMRTPGNDEVLAIGFLLTEGIIQSPRDIVEIAPCQTAQPESQGNILNVFLKPEVPFDAASLTRHFYASSSCGICGKASLEAVHAQAPPISENDPAITLSPDQIRHLPHELRRHQEQFARTGGLHAAGLFDDRGELRYLAEDVGRHNAVDKGIGMALRRSEPGFGLHRSLLMVSGRASFEIVQKALMARIPIIAAVSAPSSLAVKLAESGRQTLIGFLRDESFNCYTGAHRIKKT